MGKGDTYRPVDAARYGAEYERIFAKPRAESLGRYPGDVAQEDYTRGADLPPAITPKEELDDPYA